MSQRYPANGAALVEMRRNGRIPELPVLVSLCGPLHFSNVTLAARAGDKHDWSPVRALYVEVFASADVPWDDLLQTLADIAAVVPEELVLTFREGPRIHCGEMGVIPGQDFALFDWFPMPIMPEPDAKPDWRGSRVIANRLLQAVGNDIPDLHWQATQLSVQIALERHQHPMEIA